ncbi:hypothetical protein [Thiocystis violacea]|uniref:hypothetical protein n=1 Tax=Thiocystis violacea TaxID=13725 RepID=UPI0031F8CA7A
MKTDRIAVFLVLGTLATGRSVQVTGDTGVLKEPARFLEGRLVGGEDDSYYDLPGLSSCTACALASMVCR